MSVPDAEAATLHVLPRRRLRPVQPHRLSRPRRHLRDHDGHRQAAAPDRAEGRRRRQIREAAHRGRHDLARRGRPAEGQGRLTTARGAAARRHRSPRDADAVLRVRQQRRADFVACPQLRQAAGRRLPALQPAAAGRLEVLPVLRAQSTETRRRRGTSDSADTRAAASCRRPTSRNSRSRTRREP